MLDPVISTRGLKVSISKNIDFPIKTCIINFIVLKSLLTSRTHPETLSNLTCISCGNSYWLEVVNSCHKDLRFRYSRFFESTPDLSEKLEVNQKYEKKLQPLYILQPCFLGR